MNSVADDERLENNVHYGIADCRRRLRSQRSTLRHNISPKHDLDELSPDLVTVLLPEQEEAAIT